MEVSKALILIFSSRDYLERNDTSGYDSIMFLPDSLNRKETTI